MIEIWKDIDGYNGDYQISNFGKVKSFKQKKERILKPGRHNLGYLMVDLCLNNNRKSIKIHRLVAQAFIENPNSYDCVDHIDNDKTNNIVTNLRWCSLQENSRYAKIDKLYKCGEDNGFAKLTNQEVVEIKELLKSKTLTQHQIAQKYKVSDTTISYIKSNKYWIDIN